ncbi:MAG: ATP-binding cassette domain-containing protein [Actinomycetota bacterium]|nr:ATP-binding cassette domain-containing protein [Actinomycetota bacterium]
MNLAVAGAREPLDELFQDVVMDPPSASVPDAIVVEQLAKRYPDGTEAVRGVSFRVKQGEFYGILGPNGAGKSTTIGMLGTLVRPTSGRALVAGVDVAAHPRQVESLIGFAMQEVGVDDLATGQELLVLQARLNGLSRRESERRARLLLDLVDLGDAAGKRMGAYSGGMKRRVDLASALIHMPPILFLDEPTEGLDPRGRVAIWETLQRLNEELAVTVVLTTHYMEEADRLCDRIGIIDEGRIVLEGSPDELKASVGSQSLILSYGSEASPQTLALARAALSGRSDIRDVIAMNGTFSVYVEDAARLAPELLRMLEQEGAPPKALSIKQPTLEDVYLRYTGRTFEKAEAGQENTDQRSDRT